MKHTRQSDVIEIRPLQEHDRERWESLARGYQSFYSREFSAEGYEACWRRLMAQRVVFALGAIVNGELVGIAHYLFHARVWRKDLCYLQDLFVREESRGLGVAKALIDHLANIALQNDCSRLYWHTREDNERARKLYDAVATFDGFIRYEYELQGT